MINPKSNQIFLGDALEILLQFPDESIDLLFSDPPYYVLNKENISFEDRADIIQDVDFDQFPSYEKYLSFTTNWVNLVARKMKSNSNFLCFFAAQYITDLMRICERVGMEYKGVLTWLKANPATKIRKTGFVSASESLLYMARGNPTFNFLGQRKMLNVFRSPICAGEERIKDLSQLTKRGTHPNLHPTQKPEKVCAHYLSILSNPREIVCDPFAGVGSINAVCQKMARKCIGIEINPIFHSAACNRLNQIISRMGKTTQSQLFQEFHLKNKN